MDAESAAVAADIFLREIPDVKTRLVSFFHSNLISWLIVSTARLHIKLFNCIPNTVFKKTLIQFSQGRIIAKRCMPS